MIYYVLILLMNNPTGGPLPIFKEPTMQQCAEMRSILPPELKPRAFCVAIREE